MGKSLIITEKPSVARDFARVLNVTGRQDGYIENGQYVITWCVGHLVEMVYPEEYDEKYKKWRLEDLPFLPKEYKYGVIDAVSKQYDIVHGMLMREDIDRVYWAGDAGKEGQTIEENIRSFGGVREGMEELRVWIDSQTDEEILRGIREARPMSDYASLGQSGVMRTIEDYAMGINFSRVMSIKYGNLLNRAAQTKNYTAIAVGRVMTCVLGMVVIREREIRNFVETPFYRVMGEFAGAGLEGEWKATEKSNYFESPLLYKENGFKKEEDARNLIQKLEGNKGRILSLEKGQSRKKPPLLFNLAELQAECAKRFKISPDETLAVVQELYEKKLTTYPRTDARVLSTAIAKEIVKNVSRLKTYDPVSEYVETIMEKRLYSGIEKSQYTDDSKITDHYAIIPTGQLTEVNSLSPLQVKIFELIVRRFLSIFYPPALYENVKLVVEISNPVEEKEYKESFFASAKVLKDPGYLTVAGKNPEEENEKEGADGEEQEGRQDKKEREAKNLQLLELSQQYKAGDEIQVDGFGIKEGKTSPPKRYTSGSMVLAMENAGQLIEDEELRAQIKGSGIGTSATRAEIIKKLVRIGYLNLNKKTQILTPEQMGEMVYEVVAMTVPALLNPKMTASWEKGLEGITNKTVDYWEYREKLENFIRQETVSMIGQDLRDEITGRIQPLLSAEGKGLTRKMLDIDCPVCGAKLCTTPFGYGCSTYKKDGTGCKFSIGNIAGRGLSEQELTQLLTEGRTQVLEGFVNKSKKKFSAALVKNTGENGEFQIGFDFADVEPNYLKDVVCPSCGGKVIQTSYGFVCENNRREEENGCKLFIGKIAGKALNASQVTELLVKGQTSTIRGFTSKSNKKFDACLKLSVKEDKTVSIDFDFENAQPKIVKDTKCPLCGGDIIVTPFGYGCSNYKKDEENSCRFMIGKIGGVKLKEASVRQLLQEGITETISGFKSKNGKKFDAQLKLVEGQIQFFFPDAVEPVECDAVCPVCNHKLLITKWYYECGCGFKVHRVIAQRELSVEEAAILLKDGFIPEKLTGFVAKSGNNFEAWLTYQPDEGIKFCFEEEKIKEMIQCSNVESKI